MQWVRDFRFNIKYLFIAFRDMDMENFRYYWSKFVSDLLQPFTDIKYGIQNLIEWFPIIWNNRGWDHSYFYRIVKKQLQVMEGQQRVYARHIGAEREAQKMRVCINLIDRIVKDDYCAFEKQQHEFNYGRIKLFSTPSRCDSNGKPLTYKVDILRTKVNPSDKKRKEYERKSMLRIHKKEKQLMKYDNELLWKIISKNIKSWWD